MDTIQLNAIGFGYVDQSNQTTHYTVDNNTWYKVTGMNASYNALRFLAKFEAFPQAYRHYNLIGVKIGFALTSEGSERYDNFGRIEALLRPFDPDTVTWASVKEQLTSNTESYWIGSFSTDRVNPAADVLRPIDIVQYSTNRMAAKYLVDSQCIYFTADGPLNYFSKIRPALLGGGLMYAQIIYDPLDIQTSQIHYKSGPKSGYYNPRNSATFQWEYKAADDSILCADDSFEQSSATFYWKKSTDENYTAVAISGSSKTVTIAANTFPTASTIQWYVSGTDEEGTTTQTEVFSFSTAASLIDVVCKNPLNSVEDGSTWINFKWEFWSADGYPASRTEVYWKKDSDPDALAYWHTLLDVSSSVTGIAVAGGTIPAGKINWKVIATNIDGAFGGTVGTADFICVTAPDPPTGLEATEVPLTTISWQSGEQQAYEISIDGNVLQRAFGNVYSWTVQEPLSAGDHVISVRVQGLYGFWSQPSEITITVGGATDTITLTGEFAEDAILTTDVTDPDYTVRFYRDDVFIGSAIGNGEIPANYYDRVALGTHSYLARIFLNDGNYYQSNTVTGTMETDEPIISEINPDGTTDGAWLKLTYSINSDDAQSFDWSKTATLRHVGGARYPDIEISHYEMLTASYNCAFTDPISIQRFDNLKGKLVILKSRGGNVVTGALTRTNKRVTTFYTAYVFTIQQIHLEGVPDA